MNETDIQKSLKSAFDEAESSNAPSFDKVWANAESAFTSSRRRHTVFGGAAAAIAVLGIIVSLWPTQQAALNDDYFIADALLNSTMWSAPSDSLLPAHQFDIYQEIHFLNESTPLQEGTLL